MGGQERPGTSRPKEGVGDLGKLVQAFPGVRLM